MSLLFRMLGWLKGLRFFKFLTGWKMFAAVALVAFSSGAFSAYYIMDKFQDAALSDALSRALSAKDDYIRKLEQRFASIQAANDEAISALIARKEQIREVEKIVIKEIPVYVEVNPSCNLSSGAVGLLNSARSGRLPGARGENDRPQASGGASEEERSATAFTQRQEIEAHADCAFRYNDLAAKHDALVDWILQIQKNNPEE